MIIYDNSSHLHKPLFTISPNKMVIREQASRLITTHLGEKVGDYQQLGFRNEEWVTCHLGEGWRVSTGFQRLGITNLLGEWEVC